MSKDINKVINTEGGTDMYLKGVAGALVFQLGSIIDKGQTISLEKMESLVDNGKILDYLNDDELMNSMEVTNILDTYQDKLKAMTDKLQDRLPLFHPYDTKRKFHIHNNGYVALLVITMQMILDGDI